MPRSLRAQLSLALLLILLVTVGLISVLSNGLIHREFERYIARQEAARSASIVADLGAQYSALTRAWNQDFLHTIGMSALYDGYILKVYDADGGVLWDAEHHDMSLCGQIMSEISDRMDRVKSAGGFVSQTYDLRQNGQADGQRIGSASVTYYGPYFFSENDFQFIRALNAALLVIGGLACAFSVVVGGLLARRIARPIAQTAYIATQIAGGNYDIRFESGTSAREMTELASAINHLAGALAEQEALRKRLTTDVAHELRTPLTAVSAHLEAMIEGLWAATPERLQGCYEEIQRLGSLVADLQRLAKVEGENLKLQRTRVDLLEIARAAADTMAAEAAKKNLSLSVVGDASFAQVDRGRMLQVVTNLLSNAIKYTPEGGHIEVEAAVLGESGVIRVTDDGIGIPAAERALIFERFYRTDKSRNRKTGGAGIGLTIVKAIVAAHGGTITVDDGAERGSCFTVVLPQGRA